jgi:hypothetical protein
VLAPTSVGFGGVALFHFLVGYVWGTALMAAPLTSRLALFATFLGGAFLTLAMFVGTAEWVFAWAGPLAALAVADTTGRRNIEYSVVTFLLGLALTGLAFAF